MVNVNAQFPFNLNHDHPDNTSSRSSRNVSGGTHTSSRAASPSPPRQLHRSPSAASLRPDAQDLQYLPLVVNPSAPIHSVRLVRSARSTHSIRGRSLRTGDPNSRTPALDTQSESAPDEELTPRAHPPTEQPTPVSPLSLPCPRHRHEPFSKLPINSETPPHHPEDFNILDAGAVARSWGD